MLTKLPETVSTLMELFDFVVEQYSSDIAYEKAGAEVSYAQLGERIKIAAARLPALIGPSEGEGSDRSRFMAAVLPNGSDLFELFLLAAASGYILFPINTRLADREVEGLLHQVNPALLFVDPQAAERLPVMTLPNSIGKVVLCGGEVTDELGGGGYIAYEALFLRDDSLLITPPPSITDSASFVQAFATSGTTGVPKLVRHSHSNIVAHVRGSLQALDYLFEGETQPCWGHFTPMFHVGDAAFVWIGVAIGARHVFSAKPLDVESLVHLMRRERVSATKLVPTLVRLLVSNPRIEKLDFPSLKFILTGGDKPEPELVQKTQQILGCDFIQGYGMTEATCHVAFKNESRETSETGLLPISGLHVRILDDTGAVLGPDQVGEIAFKGASVFGGYVTQNEFSNQTEKAVNHIDSGLNVHFDADGYFRSGDAGYLDTSGRLSVSGRIKDMIIVGGENVFAKEVEVAANEIEGVALSCAFGMPDALLGEVVSLAVVSESQDVTQDYIASQLSSRLANFKRPRRVFFVTEFPQTASGKIKRAELRASLMDEVPEDQNLGASASDKNRQSDVVAILATILGPQMPSSIDLHQSMFDMNMDSLDMLAFVSGLEESFGCQLPDTFVFDQVTLANVIAYLAALNSSGGAQVVGNQKDQGSRSGSMDSLTTLNTESESLTPEDEDGSRQAYPWMFYALQTLGLLLRPGLIVSSIGPALLLTYEMFQISEMWVFFAATPLLLLSISLFAMGYLLLVKWLIVGRLGAAEHSTNSAFYCRWLMVHNLFRSVDPFLGVFRGTRLLAGFYRLCGVKIGREVVIETLDIADFDLITIGNDVCISRSANIQPSLVVSGELQLRPIEIASHARIGYGADLSGGDVLEENSKIEPLGSAADAKPRKVSSSDAKHAGSSMALLELLLTGYVAVLALYMNYLMFHSLSANSGMSVAEASMQSPLLALAGVVLMIAFLRFGSLPLTYFLLVCGIKRLVLPALKPRITFHNQRGLAKFGNGLYLRMIDVPFFKWATQLFNMSELVVVMYRLLGCRIGEGVFLCAPYVSAPELVDIGDDAMIAGNIALLPVSHDEGWVDVITLEHHAGVANSCVLSAGVTIGSEALLGDLSFAPSGYTLDSGAIAVGRPPRVIGRTDFQERQVRGLRYAGAQSALIAMQATFGLGATVLSWLAVLPGVAYFNTAMPAMLDANTLTLGIALIFLLLLPNIFTLVAIPIAKFLFIRQFNAGEYPFFSWTYVRWVLLETLLGRVEEATTSQFNGTYLAPLFYEAMGAHVERDAVLMGSPIAGEFDLKFIGAGAALNHQSKCLAHSIKRHTLIFEPIRVEAKSVLYPFSIVEAGATVKHGTTVNAAVPFHAARNAQGVRPYEKLYLNTHEFEAAAKAKLSPAVFDYFSAGAADEITLKQNSTVFSKLQIVPRVLQGVAEVDGSSQFLGSKIAFPAMVAPIAMQHLAHRDAEVGAARAAATNQIPFILSMFSGTTLEVVGSIGAPSSSRKLLQLYLFKDRAISRMLIARAEESGYDAIVLTVDAPVSGKRERDRHNYFTSNTDIRFANLLQETSRSVPTLAGFDSFVDAGATWTELEELQRLSTIPIYLKGILHPADARRSLELGVKGIMVSNHGGRQLDTSPTGLEMLPEINVALGAHRAGFELYVDGGIRRGSDIFKAIALGANGVLIGRPVVYGLATDGFLGAAKVINLLKEEFIQTLQLAGCHSTADIDRQFLRESQRIL